MPVILEAEAVFRARDASGNAFAGIANKLKEISKAGKTVGDAMSGVGRQIADMQGKLARIEGFRNMSRGLDEASQKFRLAKQEADRLARAMQDVAKPTGEMQRAYDRAARSADAAKRAFMEQGQAVRQARSGLEAAGIPVNQLAAHQERLRRAIETANASMQRQGQLARNLAAGQGPWGPTGGGRSGSGVPLVPLAGALASAPGATPGQAIAEGAAAVGAGALAKRAYEKSRDQLVEFDREARRQSEVLNLSPEARAAFQNQAVRIGIETRYSTSDVIRAQMAVAQGLPKQVQQASGGGVVRSMVEEARWLAEALDKTTEPVDMNMAGELLRARLNAGNYDISSPDAARASSRRAVNELVELAKISGMSFHDLMGYTKFGEATGRTAGMSQSFMDASVAALRRVGFEGSMGGNFIRALGVKLSAPTRNTLDAINAAGLRYQDYQKPGADFSVEGMADMLRRRFGRDVSGTTKDRLQSIFSEDSTLEDQGRFITAITDALVEGGFAKRNKKGEVNAQDRERIAKAAETFYRLNAEGTDVQRLVSDLIFGGKITPALARYLAGQEHGGRLLNIKPGALTQDMETMANVPQDRAERIARETMSGPAGAYLRMQGAVEEMFRRLGVANEGPLTKLYQSVDLIATSVGGLPDKVLQFGTAVAGATGALIAMQAAARIGTLLGVPGAAGLGAAAGAGFSALGAAGRGALGLLGSAAGGALGGVMLGGTLLEAGKPTSPEGFKYRFDTWSPDAAAILERARRAQDEFRRDPEAARGRAMMRLGEQQNVQVQGEATVRNELKVTVEPSPMFDVRMREIAKQEAARVPLTGGANGPGSTGTTMPEAAAPSTGHVMGPR